MTSPGNLTSWKDQLLGELYDKTRSHLRGTFSEAELSVEDQAELARQRAVERVRRRAADESEEAAREQAAEMRAFVESLDDSFVLQMSSGQLLRVFRTARKREASGRPMALYVAHFPLKRHSEVVVVAEDSSGLLADITGVLTAGRVDVLEAAIGTGLPDQPGNPPLAVDLFHVRDLHGKAIPKTDSRWDKIESELEELLELSRPGPKIEEMISQRRSSGLKPRVTPAVGTQIVLDNEGSSDYSIIEVFTKDAPGVLHTITRSLSDMGLDIHLAKIGAEGERVADAFYVADGRAIADGKGSGKLSSERFAEIRAALESALAEDERE